MPNDKAMPNLFSLKPTPADMAMRAHMEERDLRALVKFLRSEKEITLTFRLYLADVLEELAYPNRGRPKERTEQKYERLAQKEKDIVAVCANEIVSRWRSMGYKNRCPDKKPINRSACDEALKILRMHFPGRYRGVDASAAELRMKPVSMFKFTRLWDEIKHKARQPKGTR